MASKDHKNADNRTDEETPARDLVAEIEEPEAGEVGEPVEARCIDCRRVRGKLAPADAVAERHSFRHTCHECRRVTWWNILRELDLDAPAPGGDQA